MSARMKLDFVSDVSCPWCAIGLQALLAALGRVRNDIQTELHFQPFELNPDMGPGGQDVQQFAQSQEMIRARGAELGFRFDMQKRSRIYNTFDAHRLLHWAGLEGKQLELKQALFAAYFTDGADPSDHVLLARIAAQVGLDVARTREILASDQYAAEVRAREEFYRGQGINAVPSIIVNDRHLIEGGHSVAVFERVLRELANAVAQPA
jgi:predicted DsbA family dithiol-disulfide isomerase